MLKLADFALLGRPLRLDDWEDLGRPTIDHLNDALAAGDAAQAGALARYGQDEFRGLHDVYCDWIWELLTQIANRQGEAEMLAMLRASQEGWMIKRTWKALLTVSVKDRVRLTAETLRAHLSGPKLDGTLSITDEGDHYRILMDPCGSGGRMRRGHPSGKPGSRLAPPYNFGVMKAPHAWSWGLAGVPYYCVHCALNELLPIEWGGHPLWVTDYHPDAAQPCAARFYKRAADIPARYYERLGHAKPPAGEGRY